MANLAPRITLRQLVQYLYETDAVIQVCEPGESWDEYTNFFCDSKFLESFLDYEIEDLAAEKDGCGEPTIRVCLAMPEEGKE